jgi:hypothetical protein
MALTHTHTVATLAVSLGAYDEIAALLRAAGYGHAFVDDGVIDMSGIGLVPPEAPAPQAANGVRGSFPDK